MDVIADFFAIFIGDPIRDFFRGKFEFKSWAIHTVISIVLTALLVLSVLATAKFLCEDAQGLAIFFGVLSAILLILDGWHNAYWRKVSKKDQ